MKVEVKLDWLDRCVQPIEWHECDKCTFTTPYRLVLFSHQSDHVDDHKKYVEIAGVHVRQSYWSSFYTKKQKSFKRESTFCCKFCPHTTNYQSAFKRHLLLMHVPEEQLRCHECSFCFKQFKCKVRFTAHLRCRHNKNGEYHQGNAGKLFRCKQCCYETTHISNMKTHQIRKHAEQEQVAWFPCQLCADYKSKTKTGLQQHIKYVHTESEHIRWFQCTECEFRTKRNYKLTTHVKSKHLPDEQIEWFNCDQCEYRAKIKQDLKFHKKVKHTPDELAEWHLCELCGYRTKIKAYLRVHERTKHACLAQHLMDY